MVSSSTVSTERHFFRSRVMQRELSGDYLGQPLQTKFEEDGMDHIQMVPIRVRLFKQIRSRSRFWIGDGTEPILVVEKVVNCNLPLIQSQMEQSGPSGFTIATKISEIGVPQDELPAIIQKLYRVVKVAVPCVPISVIIVDVTVHISISMGVVAPVTMTIGNLLDVEIIDWDTWESLETLVQSPKFIPASRSSIEGLEQTKLYSFKATVRQTECAICKEGLDQFGLEEEEEEEEGIDQQSMITCLPCSHLFHTDCIVKWLTTRTCHLCPICRNRMPTEHVSEPPQLPEGGIHWPMLLISSAGYVITIALVCRLLKQT